VRFLFEATRSSTAGVAIAPHVCVIVVATMR
jgi:hypothetical protein